MNSRIANILHHPLLLLFFFVLSCLPSPAATIHVPADQPTIQAGVDASADGDTVLVADGLYTGAGNINVLISGKAITLLSETGPQSTIIDCQGLGRGLTIGPVSSGPVTIEGFSIINGQAREAEPGLGGGAVYCEEATVILDTCVLDGNDADYVYSLETSGIGGAMYICSNSDVTLQNCALTSNVAANAEQSALGGAIACFQSTLNILDCTLSDNAANFRYLRADAGFGGALYATESQVHLVSSVISGNGAYADGDYGGFAWGGGIYASWSSVVIDDCEFIDNFADVDSPYGVSSSGGGIAILFSSSSLTVNRSIFALNVLWNQEESYGGAIYSSAQSCSINDSLFTENFADQIHAGNLVMNGCTVANGDPSHFYTTPPAGGIYCGDGSIRNSIIWNNLEPQLLISGDVSVTYSAIEGGWPGKGNIDADPLLTNGPDGTCYLGQTAAGQPLDSPCVDAGDPSAAIAEGTTRTDSVQDSGVLDMGYHHAPSSGGLYLCQFPGHLEFEIDFGGPLTAEALVELQPCMGGALEWTVASDVPWMSLTPESGISSGDPVPVTVNIDATGLPQGSYTGTISIEAADALNSPQSVPVAIAVGNIEIDHDPASMSFFEVLNQEPVEDKILEVWNGDLFVLDWTVSSDAPWLTLDPASGQSTGEHDPVTVHVDSSGLSAGDHQATITIADPAAVNSPQQIDVLFRLREHVIGYAPDSFSFHCSFAGPPPPGQQLEVWNAGYDSLMYYHLSEDASWLTISPTSGWSSGEHDVIQLSVDPSGLGPGSYPATITITSAFATNTPQLVPVTLHVERPCLVAGPGPHRDNPAVVRIFPPEQDAAAVGEFTAYATPRYGANVGSANLDGDPLDEILTGPGPGEIYGPHVRGFEVNGTPMPGLSFLAYGTNKFGVNVTGGELDGDSYDEIITGAGPGAVFGPHVRAFDYDGTPGVTPVPGVSFFAYGTPKWGVNVAAGDIDGDGYDEILTGPGPGAVYGPHVRGWNVDGGAAAAIPGVSFLAYGTNKFGVNVTAGDVDGDGIDEIVTGAGPGAVFGPHVRGWNYDGATVAPLPGYSFFAWQTAPLTHGVNVFAGTDLNDDGRDELVAGRGPAPNADTEVKVFTYDGVTVSLWISLEAYPGLSQGTNVAAGRF